MIHQNKAKQTRNMIFAVIGLIVIAAALLLIWKSAMPKGNANEKHLTVQVIHSDGSTQDFPLSTSEEYLGPALVEGGVVEENQGTYGLYILTADGETANEGDQEWWKVTKGGEMVNTGADSTPVFDGDVYELTFTIGYDGF